MSAKCDYCGQPGIQLTGETNGVLVCIDHAAKVDTPRYTSDDDVTLEMSRRVEQAERRAEEAEFHVEQLRDARDSAERRIERAERLIDSWERDAPDHSNPVFIGRLRECLRRDPAPIRLRDDSIPDHLWSPHCDEGCCQ